MSYMNKFVNELLVLKKTGKLTSSVFEPMQKSSTN